MCPLKSNCMNCVVHLPVGCLFARSVWYTCTYGPCLCKLVTAFAIGFANRPHLALWVGRRVGYSYKLLWTDVVLRLVINLPNKLLVELVIIINFHERIWSYGWLLTNGNCHTVGQIRTDLVARLVHFKFKGGWSCSWRLMLVIQLVSLSEYYVRSMVE